LQLKHKNSLFTLQTFHYSPEIHCIAVVNTLTLINKKEDLPVYVCLSHMSYIIAATRGAPQNGSMPMALISTNSSYAMANVALLY
jgi:hypothetical protein